MQVQYSTQYTVQYLHDEPPPPAGGARPPCTVLYTVLYLHDEPPPRQEGHGHPVLYCTVYCVLYCTCMMSLPPGRRGTATLYCTVLCTVLYLHDESPPRQEGRLIMQVQYSTQY